MAGERLKSYANYLNQGFVQDFVSNNGFGVG
jgi:hypothetical protein